MIITVRPQFDLGSTSIWPQKPWTSPFYGSMNGPSLKTLLPAITRLNCWPPLTIAGSNCPKHFGHYFYPNMKLFHFIYLFIFYYYYFIFFFFVCIDSDIQVYFPIWRTKSHNLTHQSFLLGLIYAKFINSLMCFITMPSSTNIPQATSLTILWS